ncbi:VCBS domain-containing protein, partial [Cyanobium sp. N5-Cardenillas]|uniref:VCBS domain-containing protein n=1 Tax=Cyanobium sp. N5-Cardenillas TaxID=2823720 RepID=UPI0020CE3477
MAIPSPVIGLSPSTLNVLYGDAGNLQLTFNELVATGYRPWLELQVTAPSDNLSFGTASWAGLALTTETYTFTRSGSSGPFTLVHPITGVTLSSATPDTLLIWQLPIGSYTASAPELVVDVPVTVVATSPLLGPVPLRAGGGYALGTDPLDNPLTDPPISAPNVTGQVIPTPLTFSKSNNLAESETVTGPNFGGFWRLSANIADGAQLSNLLFSDSLPSDLNVLGINPNLVIAGNVIQAPVGNPTAPGNDRIVINYGGPITGTTSPEEAAAQINFSIPDTLDPTTGGAITYTNTAQATTGWSNSPNGNVTIDTPASDTITARALAIQKAASTTQVVPGDSVTFTLFFQFSDYFAFGDLIVLDLLGDGLTFTPGSARINLNEQGVSLTGNGSVGFDPAHITYLPDVAGAGVDGKDSLSFDLSGWLRSIGDDGILQGGRVFSTTGGATGGFITFSASVDDSFVAPRAAGQNIKAGDTLINDVTLQGDIQRQLPGGLFLDTNRQVTDVSSVDLNVADITSSKSVVARNGQAQGATPLVLTPGDTVTYRLTVTFPTGDIQGFSLSDYLPTPVYDVDGEASGGGSPAAFDFSGGAPGSLPPSGQFSYGSLHNAPPLVDNQLKTGPAVNDLVATIANSSDPGNTPTTVDILYTVTVTGAAINDRLPITNIATASTVDSDGVSRPTQISPVTGEVLAPNLKIRKGIVVTSRDSLTGAQAATYTPALNTAGASFPAAIGAVPFSGTVNSSGISVAGGNGSTGAVSNGALDSNVTGLDAGDTLRFVVVIENIGTSYRGAFNVQLRDELPAGLSFTPGSLRIVDGSGAAISYTRPDGTAASQADIFSANGIRLSDPGPTPSDPLTGAGGGAIDGYNASSGRNIAVVTFDTSVDAGAYGQLVGGLLTNVGVLEDYTNVPSGGTGYLPGAIRLIDNATVTLRNATVSKSIVSTSESSTTGNKLAIGEIVRYRVQVTVPEGNLADFRLVDSLPTGITFLDDGSASAPIFSSGVAGSLTPATPTVSGSTLTWDFGTLTNSDRNNAVDDTIAVEFNALVTNTSGNRNGVTRTNTATVSYTGGSASGSTAVQISEPDIRITKAANPSGNVQAGDTLTYTVTVRNAAGRADAFDLVLNDALGNLGSNFDLQTVSLPGSLPPGTGSIINNSVTSGASAADGDRIQLQIDRLNSGQSFSFTYTGKVLVGIQPGTTLTNTAKVTYTGLPGSGTPIGPDNTTGSTTPGSSGADDGERNGDGGVNNYTKNASRSVVSLAPGISKITRLSSEASTSGNGVTIGEIVRFRLQENLPQGTLSNASIFDTLPTGLSFLNDNTATLAFVAASASDLSWSQGSINPYFIPSAGNNTTVIPSASFAPTTINGQVVTWNFGDFINANVDPNQIESVVIEFNAIVTNVASNQAGVTLTNSMTASAGLTGSTVQRTATATPLSVLEPNLLIDKTVAIVKTGNPGNPNATPGDTLVYTVTIRNTGTAKAFDLLIEDSLDALGPDFTLSGPPTIVLSEAGAPPATDSSIVSGSNGLADLIEVGVPELEINESVTITYRGVLSAGLAPGTALTNTADVSYSSLPGTGTPNGSGGNGTGSTTPGGSGAPNGERDGSDGTGGVNDYLRSKTVILVANRPPVAVDDVGTALEAGGSFNTSPGSNASGNVLANDTDPDPADNPLTVRGRVTAFRTGASEGAGTAGSLGSPLRGTYGQLTVNADGSYTYELNNANPTVDALDPGASLTESFNYTVSDGALSDTGVLVITIQGANDAPVSADDTGLAIEAGGTLNGTPGTNASGNVITNDRDVDNRDGNNLVAPPLGSVVSFRTGAREGAGTAGTVGAALAGLYGSLTLRADGTYTYVVDNANPVVEALNPGDTITESFNYTLLDHPGGLTDTAVLTLTIRGANDAPVAVDDVGAALEAGGRFNGTPGANASGNVLLNDIDVDSDDTPALNGRVVDLRLGATEGAGTAGTPDGSGGFVLVGSYGTLRINANGTYTYALDNANPAVDSLDPGALLSESFNYTVSDGALTDIGVLRITITGANDAPVASDDTGTAVEAGGTFNGTAGSNATGHVIANDRDVDAADGNNTAAPPQGRITALRFGDKEGAGIAGSVGASFQTLYGNLTLNADGSYVYVIDDNDPTVDALNPGDVLIESFNYTLLDRPSGLTDIAVLTVTIEGANDAPVGVDDVGTAIEAGGILNSSGGSDATGNVLTNDTDVDSNDTPALNGTVVGVRLGAAEGAGAAGTPDGSGGFVLVGNYGTLTIAADGSYVYVVDNNNPTVDAQNTGDTLQESFNYTLRDHPGGLTDIAVLTITIEGVTDGILTGGTLTAKEAGGVNNATAGFPGQGNLLDDPSLPPGTSIVAIRTGNVPGAGTPGTPDGAGNLVLVGLYGTLTVNPSGPALYTVDNSNPAVDRLNEGDLLSEFFNYDFTDGGLPSTTTITVNIRGANDAPVAFNDGPMAIDDTGTAAEAGGTFNGTPGRAASDNVIANDRDVDSNDGDNLVAPPDAIVTSIRRGAKEGVGLAGTAIVGGGFVLVGFYGTLTIQANGDYLYVVDDTNRFVDGLDPGDFIIESFNYTMIDHPGGLSDTAVLNIRINGANDAPVAIDDTGTAIEAGGVANGTPGADASGNVLANDTDVDRDDTPAVNGLITAIRTGASEGGGTAGTPDGAGGFVLNGTYGRLTINANGTYTYVVDNANPSVDALSPGGSLIETFNYTVSDQRGLTDIGVLRLTIQGANDAPVARNDNGTAVEAGGRFNGTPGSSAVGNVLLNDTDVDSDDTPLRTRGTVTAIRLGGTEGVGPAATVGDPLQGAFGALTINADGIYTYAVADANPIVEALNVGDTLSEQFNYTVRDNGGLSDAAVLTITIQGANDAPVSADDNGVAIEAGGTFNGTPGADATGNVLLNDTDVDANNTPFLNGTIQSVRLGSVEGAGSPGLIGTAFRGLYGSLTIDSNGRYRYVVDNANSSVDALNAGDVL